jgi:SAM-dependent methyltransferase
MPDPRESEQTGELIREFTHQARAFLAAPVMRSQETLAAFLAELPTQPGQRWLDVACGPGIVSCALARHVGTVVGIDLTAAMVAQATEEAAAAGVRNVHFLQGDATALPFGEAAFDGVLTRFSLHHIPHPVRVLREMARVARAGGCVAVADHLTAPQPEVAAWHDRIERLRDLSHWGCLSADGIAALGTQVGLHLRRRRLSPFDLDWEEWLQRGSGGCPHRAEITELLQRAPAGSEGVFRVEAGRLHLALGIFVWQRAESEEGPA